VITAVNIIMTKGKVTRLIASVSPAGNMYSGFSAVY